MQNLTRPVIWQAAAAASPMKTMVTGIIGLRRGNERDFP